MQAYLEEDRHSAEYNWLVLSNNTYLKRFKSNLVNWLEWSEEAFKKAKRDKKLVFILISDQGHSIGNLFDEEQVVNLLNSNFVCINVDHEQCPEIAAAYLKVSAKKSELPLFIVLSPEKDMICVGNNLTIDKVVQLIAQVLVT